MVGALGAFSCLSAYCQEFQCYCYENDENRYVEWLCVSKDSAIVVGKLESACGDGLDFESLLKSARANHVVWELSTSDEGKRFTKVVKVPSLDLEMVHEFLINQQDAGLEVNVTQGASKMKSREMAGPPQRFCHKWDFEDMVPLQQIIQME